MKQFKIAYKIGTEFAREIQNCFIKSEPHGDMFNTIHNPDTPKVIQTGEKLIESFLKKHKL